VRCDTISPSRNIDGAVHSVRLILANASAFAVGPRSSRRRGPAPRLEPADETVDLLKALLHEVGGAADTAVAMITVDHDRLGLIGRGDEGPHVGIGQMKSARD